MLSKFSSKGGAWRDVAGPEIRVSPQRSAHCRIARAFSARLVFRRLIIEGREKSAAPASQNSVWAAFSSIPRY